MYEIIKNDDYDLLKLLIEYIDTIPEEVLIYTIKNGRVNLLKLLIYPNQDLTKSLTTAIKSNQYKIIMQIQYMLIRKIKIIYILVSLIIQII